MLFCLIRKRLSLIVLVGFNVVGVGRGGLGFRV